MPPCLHKRYLEHERGEGKTLKMLPSFLLHHLFFTYSVSIPCSLPVSHLQFSLLLTQLKVNRFKRQKMDDIEFALWQQWAFCRGRLCSLGISAERLTHDFARSCCYEIFSFMTHKFLLSWLRGWTYQGYILQLRSVELKWAIAPPGTLSEWGGTNL